MAFPRCFYLGENKCGRLCFQQMRVRTRLRDGSADKGPPGRGAPPSPPCWDGMGTRGQPLCVSRGRALLSFVHFKPEVGFTSSLVPVLGGAEHPAPLNPPPQGSGQHRAGPARPEFEQSRGEGGGSTRVSSAPGVADGSLARKGKQQNLVN